MTKEQMNQLNQAFKKIKQALTYTVFYPGETYNAMGHLELKKNILSNNRKLKILHQMKKSDPMTVARAFSKIREHKHFNGWGVKRSLYTGTRMLTSGNRAPNVKNLSIGISSGLLTDLEELRLDGREINDNVMDDFADAWGELTKLKELDLDDNRYISDLTSFSNALENGALPMLSKLSLSGNQISDLTSFSNALQKGALSNLEFLRLDYNEISNLTSFSNAIQNGALPKLNSLWLHYNEISNYTSLSNALQKGALPKLNYLVLSNYPTGIPQRLKTICQGRKIKLIIHKN